MKNIHLIALTAVVVLCTTSCTEPKYTTLEGTMLGTTFRVTALTNRPTAELYSELMAIDSEAKKSMSIFDETSLLSRINRNETNLLDSHIIYNLEIAEQINKISDGAYDITVKPLTEAYGFAAKGKIDRPNIDSLIQFVGSKHICIKDNRIVKDDPRVQLDLNSIAKGYTVDMVAKWLDKQGVENYLVEIGGEIRTKGVNPKGESWRVAVDSPFDGNMSPGEFRQTVVALTNRSLATSGNYRRFYLTDNGNKIAHTISPLTGQSVTTRLLSATVLADNCTTADALGTMFMAVGEHRAIELATAMRDSVEVYFIIAPLVGEEYEIFSTLKQ